MSFFPAFANEALRDEHTLLSSIQIAHSTINTLETMGVLMYGPEDDFYLEQEYAIIRTSEAGQRCDRGRRHEHSVEAAEERMRRLDEEHQQSVQHLRDVLTRSLNLSDFVIKQATEIEQKARANLEEAKAEANRLKEEQKAAGADNRPAKKRRLQ